MLRMALLNCERGVFIPMELSWNLVVKNLEHDSELEARVRDELGKLERHLRRYPPDAMHLQVAIGRYPRKSFFTVALTLRLPSNVLRVEKSGAAMVPVLDDAIAVLARQIEGHRDELRQESIWKRRGRMAENVEVRFARVPQRDGEGPETLAEIIRDLLRDNYPRFFRYVRRRVRRAELSGAIFEGAIDPRGVLDEAARQALSGPDQKPSDLSFRLWIYRLIKEELNRRFERLKEERRDSISMREQDLLRADTNRARGDFTDRSLDFVDRTIDSAVAELSGVLPHPEGSPEETLEHRDLLNYLHDVAHQWPLREQHVFELHFVEGLSSPEVSLVERIPQEEVEEMIRVIQGRLRTLLFEEAEQPAPL